MADTANILALAQITTDTAAAVAPLGTAVPATATEALNAAFVELGHVTDDGVVNSPTRTTTKHYNWAGKTVKVTTDRYTETVKLSLYETGNLDVLETVFGAANVSSDGDTITVEHSALPLDHMVFAFTGVDGDNTMRTVIRNGQITEVGNIVMKHNQPTVFELTIDVFETAAGENGVFHLIDSTSGS